MVSQLCVINCATLFRKSDIVNKQLNLELFIAIDGWSSRHVHELKRNLTSAERECNDDQEQTI